jgi:hypothetical protein
MHRRITSWSIFPCHGRNFPQAMSMDSLTLLLDPRHTPTQASFFITLGSTSWTRPVRLLHDASRSYSYDSYNSVIKYGNDALSRTVTKSSRNFAPQHHTFLWLYNVLSLMSVVVVTSAPFSFSFVWIDTSLLKGIGVSGG